MATAIILPFLAWNPGAFVDDTVRYVAGVIPFSYPLSGTTVMQLVRYFGWAPSPWTMFPSWPLQLAVIIPLLTVGIRQMRRQPTASLFLGWSVMTILGVTIVSRFAPDNYFLALAELAIAAYAVHHAENPQT